MVCCQLLRSLEASYLPINEIPPTFDTAPTLKVICNGGDISVAMARKNDKIISIFINPPPLRLIKLPAGLVPNMPNVKLCEAKTEMITSRGRCEQV